MPLRTALYPRRSDDGTLKRVEPSINGERGAITKLHVVLHGLMGIRVFERQQLEVHIPDVPPQEGHHGGPGFPGHIYRAGTHGNLFKLPPGHDYTLTGVSPGSFAPNWNALRKRFIVLSESENDLLIQPNGTHARIVLPWPERIDGVRQLVNYMSPNPLFKGGHGPTVDPRALQYIYLITYDVPAGQAPALLREGQPFWHTEALEEHNRLHVYADPPTALLDPDEYEHHTKHAYTEMSQRLFGIPDALVANLDDPRKRNSFLVPMDTEEIPHWEQVDLVHARMHLKVVGCTGNCLAAMIID